MDTLSRRNGRDAIEMIEADHARMKDLLAEYHDAGREAQVGIAERLFEEIELHAKVVKEVLYPIIRSRSRFEGRRLMRAALRQQDQVMDLIIELQGTAMKNGHFAAGMKQIEDAVLLHIDAEEEDMLPLAERALDGDAETVGERMLDFRLQLAGAGSPLG